MRLSLFAVLLSSLAIVSTLSDELWASPPPAVPEKHLKGEPLYSEKLHRAIQKGAFKVPFAHIKAQLDGEPRLLEGRDERGATPLHVAASEGGVATLAYLLERGVAVDPKTVTGATPLHAAVANGRGACA